MVSPELTIHFLSVKLYQISEFRQSSLQLEISYSSNPSRKSGVEQSNLTVLGQEPAEIFCPHFAIKEIFKLSYNSNPFRIKESTFAIIIF